jgi:hypothetical protein
MSSSNEVSFVEMNKNSKEFWDLEELFSGWLNNVHSLNRSLLTTHSSMIHTFLLTRTVHRVDLCLYLWMYRMIANRLLCSRASEERFATAFI